jgi:hypothetical protein
VERMVRTTELLVISEEPLLAILTLHTEDEREKFAINESVAHGLIDMLVKFVSREAKPS